MLYGLLIGISIGAPVAYLIVCDIKNHNMIKNLQQQVTALKSTISEQNDEITCLKNNSHAKIAYDILKNNCRKMGTCHLFK